MTYLNFLIIFLGGPLVALSLLHGLARRGQRPSALVSRTAWVAVIVHMFIALAYTTPWDNYLVASGVWTYDPALVLGITFGWVPLEEYLFFLLQPLAAGMWLLWLARRLPAAAEPPARPRLWRVVPTAVLGALWVGAVALLVSGWAPGTYLALELAWAMPPIMLQTAVGGDILWRHRRLVGTALLTMTAYLSGADAIAINSGTWTINPAASLNIFLGPLPVEELTFFLITNVLIVFGVTLVAAGGARERLADMLRLVARLLGRPIGPALARDEQ